MKKLVKESLDDFLGEEVFKGQIETGLTIDDVDKKEFLVGLEVEKIHSKNIAVQRELVVQNLSKNPKYYSEGMKKGLFDDVAAINTYKKYFIDKEEVVEESLIEEEFKKGGDPVEDMGIGPNKIRRKNETLNLRRIEQILFIFNYDYRNKIMNAIADEVDFSKITKDNAYRTANRYCMGNSSVCTKLAKEFLKLGKINK